MKKYLSAYANERIAEVGKDFDGQIWITLKKGYKFATSQCHTENCFTIKDMKTLCKRDNIVEWPEDLEDDNYTVQDSEMPYISEEEFAEIGIEEEATQEETKQEEITMKEVNTTSTIETKEQETETVNKYANVINPESAQNTMVINTSFLFGEIVRKAENGTAAEIANACLKFREVKGIELEHETEKFYIGKVFTLPKKLQKELGSYADMFTAKTLAVNTVNAHNAETRKAISTEKKSLKKAQKANDEQAINLANQRIEWLESEIMNLTDLKRALKNNESLDACKELQAFAKKSLKEGNAVAWREYTDTEIPATLNAFLNGSTIRVNTGRANPADFIQKGKISYSLWLACLAQASKEVNALAPKWYTL